MADFLANYPVSGSSKLYDDLLNEITEVCTTHASLEEHVWQLFFDGASKMGPRGNIVAGVGVVLVSPHNYVISRVFSFIEQCSNNLTEYNALLIRMQLVEEISVKHLGVYGDPKLILNQVLRE